MVISINSTTVSKDRLSEFVLIPALIRLRCCEVPAKGAMDEGEEEENDDESEGHYEVDVAETRASPCPSLRDQNRENST